MQRCRRNGAKRQVLGCGCRGGGEEEVGGTPGVVVLDGTNLIGSPVSLRERNSDVNQQTNELACRSERREKSDPLVRFFAHSFFSLGEHISRFRS
jgi:hypothetical protein